MLNHIVSAEVLMKYHEGSRLSQGAEISHFKNVNCVKPMPYPSDIKDNGLILMASSVAGNTTVTLTISPSGGIPGLIGRCR